MSTWNAPSLDNQPSYFPWHGTFVQPNPSAPFLTKLFYCLPPTSLPTSQTFFGELHTPNNLHIIITKMSILEQLEFFLATQHASSGNRQAFKGTCPFLWAHVSSLGHLCPPLFHQDLPLPTKPFVPHEETLIFSRTIWPSWFVEKSSKNVEFWICWGKLINLICNWTFFLHHTP